jgi:hypothetical protein
MTEPKVEHAGLNETRHADETGRAKTLQTDLGEEVDEGNPWHIPALYMNDFSPQEVGELVEQFQDYDEDGSGGIDPDELAKLFHKLQIEVSAEDLQHHFEEADQDNSGAIDFQEYCRVIALVRRGDSTLKGFAALASATGETPVAMLQTEARKRKINITYQLLEEREPTAMHLKAYVMQVTLYGTWRELKDGVLEAKTFGKVYQSVAATTRDAKFKCAMTAMSKLHGMAPGLEYAQGFLPLEWKQWLFANLNSGIPIEQCLQILGGKSFSPAYNDELMQILTTRHYFDEVLKTNPNAEISYAGAVPSEWLSVCDTRLKQGVDGHIIYEELLNRGFQPEFDIFLAQQLHKDTEKQDIARGNTGKVQNFWTCAEDGRLAEVRMYIAGGHAVDAKTIRQSDGTTWSAFALACHGGHDEVVACLLEHGADLNQTDDFGRTGLHLANANAHPKVVRVLLSSTDTNCRVQDKYGNTCLHSAAECGNAECLDAILLYQKTQVASVLVNKTPVSKTMVKVPDGRILQTPFREVLHSRYKKLMDEKLDGFDMQFFQKHWIMEAAVSAYDDMHAEMQYTLPYPTDYMIEYVLRRFDPNKQAGYWSGRRGEEVFHPCVDNADDLVIILEKIFVETFVNQKNNRGVTPLHCACCENLVCSHEDAIRCLIDEYGCDTELTDTHEMRAYNHLVNPRGRKGSPRGLVLREEMIGEKRTIRREVAEKKAKALKIEEELRVWKQALEKSKAVVNTYEAWEWTKADASKLRTLGSWEEYIDVDTGNRFYFHPELLAAQVAARDEKQETASERTSEYETARKAANSAGRATKKVKEQRAAAAKIVSAKAEEELLQAEKILKYTNSFVWEKPEAVIDAEMERLGWAQLRETSKILKEQGSWLKMLDSKGNRSYYYNTVTGLSSFDKPEELKVVQSKAKDPTGTICKHRRLWEKCKKCQEQLIADEAAKVVPEPRALSKPEWRDMRGDQAKSQRLRRLGIWQEFVSLSTDSQFYRTPTAEDDEEDEQSADEEDEESESDSDDSDDGFVKKKKQKRKSQWEKPAAVADAERERFAWAIIRRRSDLFAEGTDDDCGAYEQYMDTETGLMFWFYYESGESSTKPPPSLVEPDVDDVDEAWLKEQEERNRPKFKTVGEVRQAREEAEWHKQLEDSRRKVARLNDLAEQKRVEEFKRKNRIVDKPYLVPRKRGADPGADAKRRERAAMEEEAAKAAKQAAALLDGAGESDGISSALGGKVRMTSNTALLKARADSERMEAAMSEIEDKGSSPRSNERRRLVRMLDNAGRRAQLGFVLCEWGCKQWCMHGEFARKHEREECGRRVTPCTLGCGTMCMEDEWLKYIKMKQRKKTGEILLNELGRSIEVQAPYQQYHEEVECTRRLVPCTLKCGEWIHFDCLEHHVTHTCVKRPVPPMPCRFGCGALFEGGAWRLLELEEERLQHELEACPERLVKCGWHGCTASVKAKDRNEHRLNHINEQGVMTYTTAGEYIFQTPLSSKCLLVQVWGAGGGSGKLTGQRCGKGGGGAFVETLVMVRPGEKLFIHVGAGGTGGKHGKLIQNPEPGVFEMIDEYAEVPGGAPGGGVGRAGNRMWAAGSGGGFSSISRKSAHGLELIVLAGAGGGAGALDGRPGAILCVDE